MRPFAEVISELSRGDIKVVYSDLDGTLLGPSGSLFAAPGGGVTRAAADAIVALREAQIALVPASGRTVEQMREGARILGATDFIAELGGLTFYGLEGLIVRNYGAFTGTGTPFEAMARSGAGALLLEEFEGKLEPHSPWAMQPRECSMLFRGYIDQEEADALLERAGHRWLDVRDNGIIGRTFDDLAVDEVHAYHLMPRGVDKSAAVAADLTRRGCSKEQAVAIGDSPSDAVLAGEVAAVFIVANGRDHVEATGPWPNNVGATTAANGDGFAEAVQGVLG